MEAWKPIYRCGGLHFDRGFGARRSAAPSVYIYHLTKIPSEVAGKFCSSSRHVWKHGNLSTDAGGCISTAGFVKLAGQMPENPFFKPSKREASVKDHT